MTQQMTPQYGATEQIPGGQSQQIPPQTQQTGQGVQQFGGQQPMGGQQTVGGMQQPIGGMQQPIGGQQPGGGLQQPGGGQQAMVQGDGRNVTLEEGITNEMRVALHDFVQAANVCEWCAEQCIDEGPEMAECLRLCRDVADIATLNITLLTRDSMFGPELAQTFMQAADACAQECAKHSHRHCQECAEVLPRAVQSTQEMLASFQSV